MMREHLLKTQGRKNGNKSNNILGQDRQSKVAIIRRDKFLKIELIIYDCNREKREVYSRHDRAIYFRHHEHTNLIMF